MQAMVHKSLINIMVFVDEMLWSSKTWVFSRRQLTLFCHLSTENKQKKMIKHCDTRVGYHYDTCCLW